MKWAMGLLMAMVLSLAALAAKPVDINSATAQEIAENLNGIGLAKAQAIVDYRKNQGQFSSADDLAKVKGIGLKIVEKNRELILVSSNSKKKT